MTLYTDIPTRRQIEQLLNERAAPCVSIYLPTGRLPQNAPRDRLELKNLTVAAMEQVRSDNTSADDVAAIGDALDAIGEDDAFWHRQADSLAIFASPEHTRSFRLPNRLTSTVEVSDRFHVKPLLRAITFPHEAFVLALAQRSVRLLEIGPDSGPQEIAVPDMPRDAWEPYSNKVFKARERNYARRIDDALRGVLHGSELPLILAATETIAALFRTVNTYPALVEQRLAGNPEGETDAQLASAAREILDELYASELADIHKRFDDYASVGRAAFDVADIARFATIGAVDTALVDMDTTVPGSIDDAGKVTFDDANDAASYGVLDEIARRVFLTGGQVLAVRRGDIPNGGAAAALLRYAP